MDSSSSVSRRNGPTSPIFTAQAGLIVELDGDSHAEQAEYDARSTQRLVRGGSHVIRFTNTDVRLHLDPVLEEILRECERLSTSKSPSPQPSPGVPGEGAAGDVKPSRRGFTLLEMLTTVAGLVIVLGLMVDLARYVRNDSSVKLTKQLLYQCDVLLAQYRLHHDGRTPAIAPFANAPDHLNEATLQQRAFENNRDFVAALRLEAGSGSDLFGGLPDSIYNEATLSDAWGSPIVFMPSMHREIGIAPQDRSFFFSAGPDRRYLTQDDNLYSYEKGPEPREGVGKR